MGKATEAKKARVQALIQAKKAKRTKRFDIFRRAENYVKEYRDLEREDIRLKRDAMKEGAVIVPAEAKLAFVIRIRGVNQVHPKVRKVLKLFRLLQINNLVEESLGKSGMICIEDIVHEIITVGPNFQRATSFLWPFKLNNPTGGWRKKTNHFVEGGDFGNREEQLNVLLDNMI